jgi:CRISPR/Cas system-associated exonuclease Cas4 (RecB family)
MPARPAAEETASAAQALARPMVSGQYESNATVTAVAAFALCPRRYYLTYYLGWEGRGGGDGRPGELSASDFGRQVHALLAGEAVDAPAPEAVELAERFHVSALGRRAAAATSAGREFAFLLAIEDVVVRGQIDLWFEEAGELTVVDYKTDQVSAGEAAARAEDYALQLRLYALALQRRFGRAPATGYVYLLRPDVAVPVAFDPESLAEAERAVRRLREAQEKQVCPLRESAACRKCAHYQGLCPAMV